MPEDCVNVHRLVWSPDDFDGDRLLPSAFRKGDLEGGDENYISVSRLDELNVSAEIALAESQAEKADGQRLFRDEAFSVAFSCGNLRAEIDRNGAKPFDVTPEPIPENAAHCGIRNTTTEKGRSYINHLRLLLVNLADGRKPLSELIDQFRI